jgi:8-oxo-dGTP diphosphatase
MPMMGEGDPVDPREHGDDEATFLVSYDLTAYPRPALTVDVAILTVLEGSVHALVVQRVTQPAKGLWALPGGFVGLGESLPDAVRRILRRETGLEDVYTAQLATFGAVERDPRGRVVTVAYYALVPAATLQEALAGRPATLLAHIDAVPDEETTTTTVTGAEGPLVLAFDHAEILAQAVARVRWRLWHAPVAFALLPEEFTLLDLLRTYEAILGHPLDKNSFRRRILASGLIAPLGRRREGLRARPAELFRFTGDDVGA